MPADNSGPYVPPRQQRLVPGQPKSHRPTKVSRQIRNETLPIFFGGNIFFFEPDLVGISGSFGRRLIPEDTNGFGWAETYGDDGLWLIRRLCFRAIGVACSH